jgi:hypothetical protein
MPDPVTHRDLIGATGRPARHAIMRMAWGRVHRELALHRRAGIPPPPPRALIADALRQVWDWARAVERGARWKTLYAPSSPPLRQTEHQQTQHQQTQHQQTQHQQTNRRHEMAPFTLADYPYRGGVLYGAARAASAAVARALAAIDRGDPSTAADTLRHALDLLAPRLAEIDAADQARLARLSGAGDER